MRLLLRWILLLLALGAVAACAADPPLSPELAKLSVSLGHWQFHGETAATPAHKASRWTWDEECLWSANRIFLACSFTNVWGGRLVKSLVVDTYNPRSHGYWHYELFAGGNGAQPFVSPMTIQGDTWIESAQNTDHGRVVHERIVYRWASPTQVAVKIESSTDGVHWKTLDRGVGRKIG